MRRLLAAAVLCTTPALAIVTTDDPANHVVGPGSIFDGVGALSSPLGNCTGSLLSSGIHVLTAAHCVTAAGTTNPFAANTISIRFDLPGGPQTYTGASLFVNPLYTPIGPGYFGDLAILQLGQVVNPLAQRYELHTGPEGGLATFVGYGRRGVGATGSVPGTSGTVKRSGQNQIEALDVGGELLLYDFDNGLVANNAFGSLGLGNNEVLISPGDSGGPAFMENAGVFRIVGVNVVGACPIPVTIDFGGSCAQNPAVANVTFGEIGGSARVSLHAGWIQSFVDVPEPSTLTLIGLGLLITALKTKANRH